MHQETSVDHQNSLSAIATGRQSSFFEADLKKHHDALENAITQKRVLVIGGAGSIGYNTVEQIINFHPFALHIIDQSENELAELVRRVRSRPVPADIVDFQTLPIDYGSASFRYFLTNQPKYDLVLNFAALKHVRSEKDPFSTLQMLETNLIKQVKLMSALSQTEFHGRFFTVSTDKAANPSSMMGASKRVMEHVMFNSSAARNLGGTKTSARFANVAFSNGSLLQSFQNRLARGEPLAAPKDTRRYFVSLIESGEICLMASVLPPNNSIMVPKLDPETHLIEMQEIAERFLHLNGYEPLYFTSEEEACKSVDSARTNDKWPLIITELNTAGEKPYEEFVSEGEQLSEIGFSSLHSVNYLPASQKAIDHLIKELEDLISNPNAILTKDILKSLLAGVEPNFLASHRDSELNLDQRA